MKNKPTPDELMAAMRRHCLDCCGGSRNEVHRCKIQSCALWPWRETEAEKKEKKGKGRQTTMFDIFREAQHNEA